RALPLSSRLAIDGRAAIRLHDAENRHPRRLWRGKMRAARPRVPARSDRVSQFYANVQVSSPYPFAEGRAVCSGRLSIAPTSVMSYLADAGIIALASSPILSPAKAGKKNFEGMPVFTTRFSR